MRGYFGIGVYRPRCEENIGTLWRSAYQLGASYIFTVGARYKRQRSDTVGCSRHVPMFHYGSFDDLVSHLPVEATLVALEHGGGALVDFKHPQRAVYLLGAEDDGLPGEVLARVKHVVTIPAVRTISFNVAMAGSICLYDRWLKQQEGGYGK